MTSVGAVVLMGAAAVMAAVSQRAAGADPGTVGAMVSLAAAPVFAWEISLAVWLLARGLPAAAASAAPSEPATAALAQE